VIARYWSARTTRENAQPYARYLEEVVFSELKHLDGYRGGQLLQREAAGVIEVVVITFWQSLSSIQAFSGPDLERAVVSDRAAALLLEFDARVRHYDLAIGSPLSFI
jgi:heme-degrading monooxygenase HmoA